MRKILFPFILVFLLVSSASAASAATWIWNPHTNAYDLYSDAPADDDVFVGDASVDLSQAYETIEASEVPSPMEDTSAASDDNTLNLVLIVSGAIFFMGLACGLSFDKILFDRIRSV